MVHPAYHVLLHQLDGWAAALLLPVSLWLMVSGLDDLFVDLFVAWRRWRDRGARLPFPDTAGLKGVPQRRIAIVVPLWHEHAVIGRMLTHNLAAIDYTNYDFFIGAYPNDELTLDAIRAVEERYGRVHLALVPHDGPTSKADCLNWIYQRLLLFEEEHNVTFDLIVTHDAEDLIHPYSLLALNYYSRDFGMVQVPVLALPTPPLQLIHGLYSDEFAEFQLRDQQARLMMGSFLPSNGVGTAYTREALSALAQKANNLVFDPASLTEDYENGVRLYELKCPQLFLPIAPTDQDLLATREYFPQEFGAAVRQRTRWIMGIALQGWERHGWGGTLPQRYWYWRDRKGLLGHPVSLLANALFLYGAVGWLLAQWIGERWQLPDAIVAHSGLLWTNLMLQAVRMTWRFDYVRRLYGGRFALATPVRSVVGNVINCFASIRAMYRYFKARVFHQPLVWLKTSHAYPSRVALQRAWRQLGELLVANGALEQATLEMALKTQPAGQRLGEFLIESGIVTEEQVYEALSLQQGWPLERLEAGEVEPATTRALPRQVTSRWQVLPFQVRAGHLHVAGPELLSPEAQAEMQRHTALAIQFRWITRSNYLRLQRAA